VYGARTPFGPVACALAAVTAKSSAAETADPMKSFIA
jgi:hypothetical protein